MVCTNCGTEIADKAIVCFRCGQATAAPLRKPAPPPSRWRGPASILVFALLALAALFLGQAGSIDVPDEARYAVIAVALGLLGWRVLTRRRR